MNVSSELLIHIRLAIFSILSPRAALLNMLQRKTSIKIPLLNASQIWYCGRRINWPVNLINGIRADKVKSEYVWMVVWMPMRFRCAAFLCMLVCVWKKTRETHKKRRRWATITTSMAITAELLQSIQKRNENFKLKLNSLFTTLTHSQPQKSARKTPRKSSNVEKWTGKVEKGEENICWLRVMWYLLSVNHYLGGNVWMHMKHRTPKWDLVSRACNPSHSSTLSFIFSKRLCINIIGTWTGDEKSTRVNRHITDYHSKRRHHNADTWDIFE